MSARPPAPRADLPEGEATLKDAEQPETSLEARGSRTFYKSRCQDRIREYFTRAQSRVPTCTAQNVPQSVARAMQHARNLHANACCGSKTRCKPHGSRGRVPNLSHGGNATPSRATRCLVQTIGRLQLVAWCARLASPRARWKCCNKLKPCTPASSSSSREPEVQNRARPPQI